MRYFILVLLALLAIACGSPSENKTPVVPDAGETATPDAGPIAPVDDQKFSIVVIPDTQYLFDQDRGNADVLAASLQWIVDHTEEHDIVFTAALGDITENHAVDELADASETYRILDDHGIQYSVPAGNHDLSDDSKYDDQRGAEIYLEHFSPARMAAKESFGGATSDGYNTYFMFEGGGQKWLLLALDWRASLATLAWAQDVIDQHPDLPVIVTTHELAYEGDVAGEAVLSDYGQYLWDQLIAANDQIFLTINGHYWPPARTVKQNAAGHDVHVHLANYQDRYYGGSGMLRLYELDLARGTIEVSTFSPWVQAQAPAERNALERLELELADAANRFVERIDFAGRFLPFQGGAPPAPPALPAPAVVIDGTVAYWRFEGGSAGTPVAESGVVVPDLSGHGNDLQRVTLAGGVTGDLAWTTEHHPAQPGRGSLFFNGSKSDPAFGGAYLRTVAGAPLDAMTFEHGYTIEAFVKLPGDCCTGKHAWMGILSRMGSGADAGKTADDPSEPVTTLTVAPGGGFQWAIYPRNVDKTLTNWSHQVRGGGDWVHVAVVNDGHRSLMYIEGAEVLRNPRAESVGLSTTGEFWLVGATHYARVVEQSFYGWIGDVRIVDRPLAVAEFMTARP